MPQAGAQGVLGTLSVLEGKAQQQDQEAGDHIESTIRNRAMDALSFTSVSPSHRFQDSSP